MSVPDYVYEKCYIMDKTTQKDGYGGVNTVWIKGAEIKACITLGGSGDQMVANQRDWKGSYTVLTPKSVVFMAGDVFMRDSDGKTFRVKSDGTDEKTPSFSGLDTRAVKAEEYPL